MATVTLNLPIPTRKQSPFIFRKIGTSDGVANTDLVNLRAGKMGWEGVPCIYRLVAGRVHVVASATVATRVARIRQYAHDGQAFQQMIGLKSQDITASEDIVTALCPVTYLVTGGIEGQDLIGFGSDGLYISGDEVFQCYLYNAKDTDTWTMSLQFEFMNYKYGVLPSFW